MNLQYLIIFSFSLGSECEQEYVVLQVYRSPVEYWFVNAMELRKPEVCARLFTYAEDNFVETWETTKEEYSGPQIHQPSS